MMTNKFMSVATSNDAELVSASLGGNRDAFGQIVSRYQSLVCSLAYSATGSLSQSEDLAQETFVTAWKQLTGLREPEKLRAWLCGIARNLINSTLRKQGREPSHQAVSLEEIAGSHSPEPLPVEQTISNEEQSILWRSLERIPEIYREPLVLYYREHQSIEAVAEKLELSEDNVKQRLSRGRKLLHEEVLAFVEGALTKTAPGKTFTIGVIAALPLAVTSAKAASIGAALAKGGAAAKGVATFWSLGGMFVALGSFYLSLRARADDAKSPRERQFVLQVMGIRIVVSVLVFAVFLGALYVNRKFNLITNNLMQDIVFAAFILIVAIIGVVFLEYTSRRQRQIQIEEGTWTEVEWNIPRKDVEPAINPNGNQSKLGNYVRTLRFRAFIVMLVAMTLIEKLWEFPVKAAVPLLVCWILCIFLDFKNWRNSPRYAFRGLNSSMGIVLICGFATLLFINQNQYFAQILSLSDSGKNDTMATSSTVLVIFNFIVIFVYAASVGIFIWNRKTTFRSLSRR